MEEPRKVKLTHSNSPGKTMGEIKYLMQIVPKVEAEANPVGEA